MPKIVISDSQGLVQKTGTGVEVNSAGVKAVLKNRVTFGTDVTQNLDSVFSLPAGALITDVFVVAHAALATAGGGTFTVSLGTVGVGLIDLVAATNLIGNGAATTAGEAAILSAGTKIEGAAGAALAVAADANLYSSTARSVTLRASSAGAALATGGDATVGIEYTIA